MNTGLVGRSLTALWETLIGSSGSPRLQAPTLRVEVDEGEIDYRSLLGTVETIMGDGQLLLTWSLHNHRGDLLYRTTEYTVKEDGRTATFAHTFPRLDDGNLYTITQDVVISFS